MSIFYRNLVRNDIACIWRMHTFKQLKEKKINITVKLSSDATKSPTNYDVQMSVRSMQFNAMD